MLQEKMCMIHSRWCLQDPEAAASAEEGVRVVAGPWSTVDQSPENRVCSDPSTACRISTAPRQRGADESHSEPSPIRRPASKPCIKSYRLAGEVPGHLFCIWPARTAAHLSAPLVSSRRLEEPLWKTSPPPKILHSKMPSAVTRLHVAPR